MTGKISNIEIYRLNYSEDNNAETMVLMIYKFSPISVITHTRASKH